MPFISVIIPTYNRAELVLRAVDSVLAQTFEDFELIVVDDGSTDDTVSALKPYKDRLRLIVQSHAGVSAARNHGLSIAQSELIAFLDSDDYWLPEKLDVQARFFSKNPKALICQTEETWFRHGRRVNPGTKHRKPSGEAFYRSLELCLISPSSVMMRRKLFETVGTFDENLPACEDYDLWLRVTARYPVHLLKEPLVVKNGGHEDQLSRTTMGLDQYRVKALLKILESGTLDPEQTRAARAELVRKAEVFGQGCLKRGKSDEADWYLALVRQYDV